MPFCTHHARAERASRDWVGLMVPLGTHVRPLRTPVVHLLYSLGCECELRGVVPTTVRRTRAPRSPSRIGAPAHVPVVHAERGWDEHTHTARVATAHAHEDPTHRAWSASARPITLTHDALLLIIRFMLYSVR